MSEGFLLFTADVENTWSIDEILKKVQSTSTRRNEWRVAFKEGVDISERVIQDTFGQQDEQDYIARYDLSYLTPRSQPIRCKVRFRSKLFVSFCNIRHLFDALVYSLTEINLSKKNDFNVTVQFYMRTNPAVHKSS